MGKELCVHFPIHGFDVLKLRYCYLLTLLGVCDWSSTKTEKSLCATFSGIHNTENQVQWPLRSRLVGLDGHPIVVKAVSKELL